MEKITIQKGSVQETLVIPLYARRLCSEQYPALFRDEKAGALMERLDYDFSGVEKKSRSMMQRFGALEVAMRQSDLAAEVRDYLRSHPAAAVVNLGCGLDQTGESCDNGRCKIYNIDYPEVIALREALLPGGGRVRNIAADLNDTGWFEQIDAGGGAVFFAAGVFYYFTKSQIRALFNAMAARFSGGRLVFDAAGKTAVWLMTKTWLEQAGIRSVDALFYVGSPERDIAPWLKNARVSSRGFMLGYNDLKDPSVSAFFRLLAKLGDGMMKMQVVRLDFAQGEGLDRTGRLC